MAARWDVLVRFPVEAQARVKELAAQGGCSVNSLIVNTVLESVLPSGDGCCQSDMTGEAPAAVDDMTKIDPDRLSEPARVTWMSLRPRWRACAEAAFGILPQEKHGGGMERAVSHAASLQRWWDSGAGMRLKRWTGESKAHCPQAHEAKAQLDRCSECGAKYVS